MGIFSSTLDETEWLVAQNDRNKESFWVVYLMFGVIYLFLLSKTPETLTKLGFTKGKGLKPGTNTTFLPYSECGAWLTMFVCSAPVFLTEHVPNINGNTVSYSAPTIMAAAAIFIWLPLDHWPSNHSGGLIFVSGPLKCRYWHSWTLRIGERVSR